MRTRISARLPHCAAAPAATPAPLPRWGCMIFRTLPHPQRRCKASGPVRTAAGPNGMGPYIAGKRRAGRAHCACWMRGGIVAQEPGLANYAPALDSDVRRFSRRCWNTSARAGGTVQLFIQPNTCRLRSRLCADIKSPGMNAVKALPCPPPRGCGRLKKMYFYVHGGRI